MVNQVTLFAVVVSLGACGGGEDTRIKCSATLTGDVEVVDLECSMYICETPEFHDLTAGQIYMNAPIRFNFRGSLAGDGGFTAKTYTLADFTDQGSGLDSEFFVEANGKKYQARTSSMRTAEETATFNLTKILPAPAGKNCDGGAVGTMTVSLVEISSTGVVQAGRVVATVSLTE